MLRAIGLVVVALIVLWVIFALIGVLTAIIKSVLGIVILAAIIFGIYHLVKRR